MSWASGPCLGGPMPKRSPFPRQALGAAISWRQAAVCAAALAGLMASATWFVLALAFAWLSDTWLRIWLVHRGRLEWAPRIGR